MAELIMIVAALQYYHVASMLLDRNNASPFEMDQHARMICGLALSSKNEAVFVNSYGPICFSRFQNRWLDWRAEFYRLQTFDERQ
jgi:hypothetical protein